MKYCITKEDENYLIELSDALKSTEIEGNYTDNPEGSGWIRISATLAKEISERLDKIVGRVIV
ncbi:hypothetical protein PN4B1_16910 [Paenibacillus naphthalenovorans]|uniref:hypothetical protein n=1 Tax=Paenibacillus naphthalenovorans TaxID=162209 RepID=UPI0010B37470|nr:hypothetical protein [Paenibacillus naphthalenovorans]GCL71786.1 hypothetical protein PN4B1_16910 [Paenibacillus naphthalenovorans]